MRSQLRVQGSTGAMLVWATAVVSSKGEDRDVILEFFVFWRKSPNFIEAGGREEDIFPLPI
jgi:hypothetical protein